MNDLIKPQNLSMSAEQMTMFMPFIIMALGAMMALLAGVLHFSTNLAENQRKRNVASLGISVITLLTTLFCINRVWGEPNMVLFNNMLSIDYFTNLFNVVFVGATLLVSIVSYSYLDKEGIHHSEYYPLLLFSCLGMMLLASALDLMVLFLALETMSIGVYVLVGFRRADIKSNEAAIKYFVLGSAVSAILLMGIAMVYGATASMNISEITNWIKANPNLNPLFILGTVLIGIGFLFKVASVPFHMWMPDVYEGAPTSVTNFMTTGLKAAVFAAFLRVFISTGYGDDVVTLLDKGFHNMLWILAVLTMLIGNIVALTQKNIKRMLAYSSIAHTGYLLVGFISGAKSEYGFSSVVMYLITYVVMNIGAFAVVSLMAEKGDRNLEIDSLSGVGFKHPVLGFAMTVFMFSMAGVPPTAGFAGKYLIFSSAVQSGEVLLAVLGVLCSAISAYYYLRVIVFMYMKEDSGKSKFQFSLTNTIVIAVATIGTLQFGLFPTVLIHAAKKAA